MSEWFLLAGSRCPSPTYKLKSRKASWEIVGSTWAVIRRDVALCLCQMEVLCVPCASGVRPKTLKKCRDRPLRWDCHSYIIGFYHLSIATSWGWTRTTCWLKKNWSPKVFVSLRLWCCDRAHHSRGCHCVTPFFLYFCALLETLGTRARVNRKPSRRTNVTHATGRRGVHDLFVWPKTTLKDFDLKTYAEEVLKAVLGDDGLVTWL